MIADTVLAINLRRLTPGLMFGVVGSGPLARCGLSLIQFHTLSWEPG
ncbi:hypothetical protein [Mycobacterium lepromatosis]|nr:hypothetical protein [Mycobacterium lepromatosis]